MTREELAGILEQFAICVIKTYSSNLSVDNQYALMENGIREITDTVMFCLKHQTSIPSEN